MIKVLQSLHFGTFIVQTPPTAESGWRWIIKTLLELECYAKKICVSRERKKSCLISCHYLMIGKQAARQEYKIGEHSSCRTLFIPLSPTLNKEVLGLYQNSEENNYLPFSSFPVSTFRSSMVFPDWEIPIGSTVPVMGRKIAASSVSQQGNGYSTGTYIDNAGSCPMAQQDKCREQWRGFLQGS